MRGANGAKSERREERSAWGAIGVGSEATKRQWRAEKARVLDGDGARSEAMMLHEQRRPYLLSDDFSRHLASLSAA